jgi:hypothetical protein
MDATNLPGFTAEHSLNRSKGQYHTVASDASYTFAAEIRPQLNCVEKGGQVVCPDDGGFHVGFTDVPSGGFPRFPIDHTVPQCRARCYRTRRGAALKACLAEC